MGGNVTLGHEFCGIVEETGSDVKIFKKGDEVVSSFTTSCNECFYCKLNHSSRCTKGLVFGSPALDGGQAQYVRVPSADYTLFQSPRGIDKKMLPLMGDIFPT
jgi:threonine dehydrogenase-like Zn-dependent dehydrogenase